MKVVVGAAAEVAVAIVVVAEVAAVSNININVEDISQEDNIGRNNKGAFPWFLS